MRIAELPDALRPIVQPIDDWNRNWKLALIFECSAGSGRLLVSTLDLQGTHAGTPTLRSSLLRYMASEDFAPKVKIDLPALRSTFTVKSGTVAPTQVPAHSQDLDDPGQIVRKHPN